MDNQTSQTEYLDHEGGRIADTGSPPANGRRPSTAGRLPHWQTEAETGGASWERVAAALPYTTASGLLKQPDKHKTTSYRLLQKGACHAERREVPIST